MLAPTAFGNSYEFKVILLPHSEICENALFIRLLSDIHIPIGCDILLEYRDFPTKTFLHFLLYSPVLAYQLFVIKGLVFGTLPAIGTTLNVYYLGVASGIAAIVLLLNSVIIDKVKPLEILLIAAGVISPFIGLLGYMSGLPSGFDNSFSGAWIIATFVSIAFLLLSWVVFLNRTVIERFRGRITGIFLILSFGLVVFYDLVKGSSGMPSTVIPEVIAIVSVMATTVFKPWRWQQYPLAVHGNHMKYFVPMVLLLACHLLWFFGTKVDIMNTYDPSFVSITREFEKDIGFSSAWFEPLLLGVGAFIAGMMADIRGRKTGFNTAILLMGLLAIFSPAFYDTTGVEAIPLLLMERVIEGYLIGIGTLLIWNELGSPRTKARRLALVWFFFLGYALLFWALDHNFFFEIDKVLGGELGRLGGPFSILLALITLYLSSDTPEILGREVQMEDLALDFDDREVKATVDAFVGEEDFTSIRSQLEIMDVVQDLSDSEFGEIVGEDFKEVLPLRRIPGVGPKLEARLTDAGYTSAAQLAGESASRLSSKISGLSQERAEKLIRAAQETVKETVKGKQS